MIDQDQCFRLVVRAKEAAGNAYCPYSDFPVGAALLTKDGSVFCGCNVENQSLGATICAERVAVCNAIAAGQTEFIALAIYHDGKDLPYPCGMCRQFLSEFGEELQIIVATESEQAQFMLCELMPFAFRIEEY